MPAYIYVRVRLKQPRWKFWQDHEFRYRVLPIQDGKPAFVICPTDATWVDTGREDVKVQYEVTSDRPS